MRDFFKKYKIQFKVFEILILIALVYFRLNDFLANNKSMSLIIGIVFLVLLTIRVYDFWGLTKTHKVEENTENRNL